MAAFIIACALPREVWAHAELVRVDPDAQARLARGAIVVRLHFSENVALVRNGVRVRSPGGVPQAVQVETRASDVLVRFRADAMGTYTLAYRVIDDDTHIARGLLPINVERPTADADAITLAQSAFASRFSRMLEGVAHWLHFAGYAGVFGAAAFGALVRLRNGWPRDSTGLRASVAALLIADALAVIAQSTALEPSRLFDLDAIGDIGASSFGRLVGLDAAGALLVWAIVPLFASAPILARIIVLTDGIILAFIAARIGHAIRFLPWEASATLGALHLGAMAVWIGALLSPLRAQSPSTRIAAIAIALSLISGLALAAGHLGGPLDLVRTSYGATLAFKISLVALAVVLGLVAQRRRSTTGWLNAERAVIGVVLLAAAGLLTLAPPR